MKKIKWYSVSKDMLPMVLLTSKLPSNIEGSNVAHPNSNLENITLGYYDNVYSSGGYNPPAIISLPVEKSAEILAWLKTYAPETYPLSQFARVIKPLELKIYEVSIKSSKRKNDFKFQRWSSLILGEILAQGESDITIDSLPLSRSQATYTHSIARVLMCHNSEDINKLCLERLLCLEADKSFVSRPLKVESLAHIWSCVDYHWDYKSDIENILDVFKNAFPEEKLGIFDDVTTKELLSDSIEARVLAFRKISNAEINKELSNNDSGAMKIAMAAFLVGKGTSHIFLLKTMSGRFPSVYAWFGLIAGIVGPTCWEIDWARAIKGIEKGLRVGLNWSEPSQSDISWSEYEWISETFRNNSPFVELPKLLPRVLSIEILPGSICQLRLSIERDNSKIKHDNENSMLNEINSLKKILSDYIILTEKAKEHISGLPNQANNLRLSKNKRGFYEKK